MKDPGQRIGETVATLIWGAGFGAKFAAWSERFPALKALTGPQALLSGLRAHGFRTRDGVLAALTTLLKEGDTDASLLLLELLRPGIGMRAGWLEGSLSPDEAWQEMTAAILWAARRYDPVRFPTRIAHNLLHAALRRAERERRRVLGTRTFEASLTQLIEEEKADVWADQLPSAQALIVEATQAGAISPEEAELIRATRLDGAALQEAAPGEPYERIRKRRLRAEHRLTKFARESYPGCPDPRGGPLK
jgi:DNA-directed RNA polymerase specialized sigma24 family protein